MLIRPAAARDLAAINAIYNHYVLTSTCTYEVEPVTEAARAQWLADHGERHPATVAELDGRVVGWGCLSPYRGRFGYRYSAEHSVYVDQDHHRRGIGAALLRDLVERARALGYHTLIGGCDSAQAASIALHERHGFERVAHFREVGRKFDRWLDVIFLQRMLA